MALTKAQIYNLNNSMSAAQDVALGSVIDALITSGCLVLSGSVVTSNPIYKSGSFIPAAAVTPVVTGLSAIKNVVAGISGSLTIGQTVSATTGSVAGVIWVSCWQPTNASTITPIPATGSFVNVNWIAVGT